MTQKTFAQAFAEARRAKGPGATFEWNGKRYTTDRADDKPRGAPKASPAPQPRPTSTGPKSTASIVAAATAAINRGSTVSGASRSTAGKVASKSPTSGASRSTAGKVTKPKAKAPQASGIRRADGTLNVGKAIRSLVPKATGSASRRRRRSK